MLNAFLIFASEQSQFVNLSHSKNISSVSALPALNDRKSNEVNEEQSQNMYRMLVTFSVLNEDTLTDDKEEQLSNIDPILVTFSVLNEDKSN